MYRGWPFVSHARRTCRTWGPPGAELGSGESHTGPNHDDDGGVGQRQQQQQSSLPQAAPGNSPPPDWAYARGAWYRARPRASARACAASSARLAAFFADTITNGMPLPGCALAPQ